MTITILTSGSRGDTQPYIALGLALKKLGYKVRLAAFENYRTFVTSYGLDFFPIEGDVSVVAASDDAKGAMKADNPLKFLLSFNKLKKYVLDLQQNYYEACLDSEAIVYHPGVPLGYFVGQKFDIPSIFAPPFPMTITKEFPALLFYNYPRFGKLYNYQTHKIFEKVMWFASKGAIKQFWKKEFGKRPKKLQPPFNKQETIRNPTITSCSKYVFPKPADWSDHQHLTGYWFLDEGNWKPSKELVDFIERAEAPIYVGFGSIHDPSSAEDTIQLITDALELTGQRGILATGWSGMSKHQMISDELFIVEKVPHSWLFTQMGAVVHHGGAGTTAAGFRAGIPSVIIPFGNDQFAWGKRAYELNVGPKPIPRKKLTSKNLAKAIKNALTTNIRACASELGSKIRKENGAKTAAEIIGRTLDNS